MVRLKIQGTSQIRSVIEYLQRIETFYNQEIEKRPTAGNDQLLYISYLELIQNLLRKLRISQINGKVKVSVEILRITALILILHSEMFDDDIFSSNVISEMKGMLHKQLIDH